MRKKWSIFVIFLFYCVDIFSAAASSMRQGFKKLMRAGLENMLKDPSGSLADRIAKARNDIATKPIKENIKKMAQEELNKKNNIQLEAVEKTKNDISKEQISFLDHLQKNNKNKKKKLTEFDEILNNQELEDYEKFSQLLLLINAFELPLLDLLIISERLDLQEPLQELGFII